MKVPLKLAKRTIPLLAYLTLSVVCGATLHCLLWGPLTPFTPAQYLLLCPRKTLRPRFVAVVLQEYLNCCLFCILSMWAYLTAELDSDSSNTCKVLRLLTLRKLLLWSTRVGQLIRWTAHKIDQLLLLMYTIVTNALLTSNDGNYYFDRGPPGVFILRKGIMQMCWWTFFGHFLSFKSSLIILFAVCICNHAIFRVLTIPPARVPRLRTSPLTY